MPTIPATSQIVSRQADAPPQRTICQLLHSLTVGGAEVLAERLARQLSGEFRFVFACLDDLGELGRSQPLDPELASAVRQSGSREVVYGFRPERVSLSGTAEGMPLPVTFVERIGARTVVHLGAGEQRVKAVFDNDVAVASGAAVSIAIEPASVRLFDAGTGIAQRRGDGEDARHHVSAVRRPRPQVRRVGGAAGGGVPPGSRHRLVHPPRAAGTGRRGWWLWRRP